MSFAYLVYASAWFKRYHPAAFCAALLNAQPMGFYSPQSLVDDARRHGVEVRRPDINASDAAATLEPPTVDGGPRSGPGAAAVRSGAIGGPVGPAGPVRGAHDRRRAGRADRGRTGRARPVPGHGATWPGAAGADRAAPAWRRWPPRTRSPASG